MSVNVFAWCTSILLCIFAFCFCVPLLIFYNAQLFVNIIIHIINNKFVLLFISPYESVYLTVKAGLSFDVNRFSEGGTTHGVQERAAWTTRRMLQSF